MEIIIRKSYHQGQILIHLVVVNFFNQINMKLPNKKKMKTLKINNNNILMNL